MRVDQAIFGEVRAGHALRSASGDAQLAASIGPRLDLPDTAPPGADWSPYVSGFPVQNNYVLARTFRDPTATRSGMVFAHAIIAPLDLMIQRSNLSVLFDALVSQPVPRDDMIPLEIGDDAPPPTASNLVSAAASLLVQRKPGPVVLLGHADFEGVAAGIWARLTPALRRSFSFRLSFGPSDLAELPAPALVCTPASLVARWQGFRLIDLTRHQPASLAADLLTGAPSGEALETFRGDIGAAVSSFVELSLLEQAYKLGALEAETFANLMSAMRLVERLSPDPAQGANGKRKLLDRLVLHVSEARAADILTLRNADFAAFGPVDRLWSALSRVLAEGVFPQSEDAEFIAIVAAADQVGEALAPWRNAIVAGIASAANANGKNIAHAFWRWGEQSPDSTAAVWRVLAPPRSFEKALVAAAPAKITSVVARAMLDLSAGAKMYSLHGLAAAAALKLEDALERQLAVEPEPSDAGLRLVVRDAPPGEVIAAAIECNTPRVLHIAAELVAKNPRLIRGVDFSSTPARTLWGDALGININVWRGPANPAGVFSQILNDHLDGRSAANALIAALSRTELADLTTFPRRAEIWAAVLDPARAALLAATAKGWLLRMQTETPSTVLEPALVEAVLASPDFNPQLENFARVDPARGAQILSVLPGVPEGWFRRWVNLVVASGRQLSMIEAESIGGLIDHNGWANVAHDLLSASIWGRSDLKPALRVCSRLFSFLDRWAHGLSAITPSEKWDSLEELASELYPHGPDTEGLWLRAGGKDADLVVTGSGRSRWRAALARVRFGGGVKARRLLAEMLRDFAGNTALQFLAKDAEFGG